MSKTSSICISSSHNLSFSFYRFFCAKMISNFGTYFNMIALNIYILEKTNDPKWIGITLGIKTFSSFCFGPFLGHLADTINRKKLMILSDIILAVGMIILAIIPEHYFRIYLINLMIISGIFSSLFDIGFSSSLPHLVNEKSLLKSNSLIMAGKNLILGLAGILSIVANFIFKNFETIFILDGLTYIISGLMILTVNIPNTDKINKNQKSQNFWTEFKQSHYEVLKLDNSKIILYLISLLIIDGLCSASHNIGWPIFSKQLNPDAPMYYYGIIFLSWIIGNLLGIVGLNKIKKLKNIPHEVLYITCTGIMSLGMLLIFQTSSTFFIVIFSILAGIGDGTNETSLISFLQTVPDNIRGKVFAMVNIGGRVGLSLGFAIIPIVMSLFSLKVSNMVILFHGPIVIISFIFYVWINYPGFREKTSRVYQKE